MPTSKKRPREIGTGGHLDEEDASAEEPRAQRRRVVVYGLGLLSMLMGTACKLASSVFGRNKPRLDAGNGGSAPEPSTPRRTLPAGDHDHVAGGNNLGASLSAVAAHTPPRARVETLSAFSSRGGGSAGGACSGGTAGKVVEGSTAVEKEDKTGCVGSRTGSGNDSCSEHCHGGAGREGQGFARRLLGAKGMAGGRGAHRRHGKRPAGACGRSGGSAGVQGGLPRLCDADALRHSLGFLDPKDLAKFARASTGARDVVSAHAAIQICDRFSVLRLGMRENPHPHPSPRRLAFGIPPTLENSNPAPNNASDVGPESNVPLNNDGQQQYPSHHSSLWDREVVVGREGTAGGSGGERRRRGGGAGTSEFGLTRCEGSNLKLALPALHHLEACGDLLYRQLKTLPRLDLFRTLQSRAVLGSTQFLTAHMRAVLVDWMVEVAFQFRLSTISLHAAVSALDVCLSKVAVPRCRLQLLGVVCAMIQSQAGEGCQVMSTTEAIHICDSQYNPSQVHSTFNIVVSNTQEPTARTVPATAAEILHRLLLTMREASGLARPLSGEWEKLPYIVKEENVLAGLLIDLSLLDQDMFRFRPGTVASAALLLARVTALFYSKEELMVTPFAVVERNNREVLRLYGEGVCRPFIPPDEDFEKQPFGSPGLGEFVSSQPKEAVAVRKCVERLWLVHQDFLKHVAGEQWSHPVLFRYQHMFKGIKDKFVPLGSLRLQAYRRLGLLPKHRLDQALDKHLPSSPPSVAASSGGGGGGGGGAAAAAAAAATAAPIALRAAPSSAGDGRPASAGPSSPPPPAADVSA